MTSQPEQISHKDASFWIRWILILLGFIFVGIIIASGLAAAIGYVTNVEIGVFNLKGLSEEQLAKIAGVYRLVIFLQHLFVFILPAVLTMILYKRKTGNSLFHFSPRFNPNAALIGVFILLAAYPLVQFGAEVNQFVPLPSILKQMEDNTAEIVKLMLTTDSIYILLVNILLIALVPAIGEELIFRGFLQHFLSKLISNPHVNVWVTAIIFSTIHMQFEGFLPRMILGLVLGYLMMWSGNIIYPMIAHFFNNALTVVVQFFLKDDVINMDQLDKLKVPFWVLMTSILLLMLSTQYFRTYFKKDRVLI